MNYIIETQNLTKCYGEHAAVRDVSLHVPQGAIYGLLGRNGAGKTTVMKMLLGLARPNLRLHPSLRPPREGLCPGIFTAASEAASKLPAFIPT